MKPNSEEALKEAVGEVANETESPVVEQEAVEEVKETETPAETEVSETETTGEPKKSYQSRVRELVKERNEARNEAKSLAEKLAEISGSNEQVGNYPQYTPQVEPGSEISPDQYKQDVLKSADALVTLRVKQSEAVNRINNEAIDSVRKYPELDPTNDNFNEELSDTVTEAVEAYVKSNPYSASVTKFVDKLMKPYKRAVTKEVGQATEQIAKQVTEAALRPTSIRKEEKPAQEKSIEELEKELGILQT